MKLSQLKIDPEFQSKIPPLQFEEEQQLEQNIIAEGRLLNPIITWNGYILDGHTRYRILKKHGFIKFEVEEIQLANKYEALAWICKNQLGRRNLSPERKKFLLGKEYESTKLAVGAPLGSKHGIRKCGQNDHIFTESRTCQRIASEHGVGEKTVRRAEKYSRGIDAAEEAVPGAREEILTGHTRASTAGSGWCSSWQGHTRKPSRSWLKKTPAVLQTVTCGRFSASITVPAVRRACR